MDDSEKFNAIGNEISKYLENNPLQLAPWDLAAFFENKTNVSVADSDTSLHALIEKRPNIEPKFKSPIDELRKLILILFPNVLKLPISALLHIARELSKFPDILSYLPEFPAEPSDTILDYFISQFGEEAKSWTSEEKTEKFRQITDCNAEVVEHLFGWKKQITEYVSQLEKFSKKFGHEMTVKQQESIDLKLERSKNLLVTVGVRLEAKKKLIPKVKSEYEQFYDVISRDEQFKNDFPHVRRQKIRDIFDSSSEAVIRAVLQRSDRSSEEKELAPPQSTKKRISTVSHRKSHGGDEQASPSTSEDRVATNGFQSAKKHEAGKKFTPKNKENIKKRALTDGSKTNASESAPLSAKRVRTKPKRFEDGFEENGKPKLRPVDNQSFRNSDHEEEKNDQSDSEDSFSSSNNSSCSDSSAEAL